MGSWKSQGQHLLQPGQRAAPWRSGMPHCPPVLFSAVCIKAATGGHSARSIPEGPEVGSRSPVCSLVIAPVIYSAAESSPRDTEGGLDSVPCWHSSPGGTWSISRKLSLPFSQGFKLRKINGCCQSRALLLDLSSPFWLSPPPTLFSFPSLYFSSPSFY